LHPNISLNSGLTYKNLVVNNEKSVIFYKRSVV